MNVASGKVLDLANTGWAYTWGRYRPRGRRGETKVCRLSPAHSTYFICLTMVLFPDSPAPGTKDTGGQGAGPVGTQRPATSGPAMWPGRQDPFFSSVADGSSQVWWAAELPGVRLAGPRGEDNLGHLDPMVDSLQALASHKACWSTWFPAALAESRGFGWRPEAQQSPCHSRTRRLATLRTVLPNVAPGHSRQRSPAYSSPYTVSRSCRGAWVRAWCHTPAFQTQLRPSTLLVGPSSPLSRKDTRTWGRGSVTDTHVLTHDASSPAWQSPILYFSSTNAEEFAPVTVGAAPQNRYYFYHFTDVDTEAQKSLGPRPCSQDSEEQGGM